MEHEPLTALHRRTLDDAVRALHEATELQAEVHFEAGEQEAVDALLDIHLGDQKATFALDIKAGESAIAPAALKAREDQRAHPLLLIAPYVNRQTAERCRSLGLSFIDSAGNVLLKAPGLYVFITGQPRKVELTVGKPKYQALTATGLRLVYMLLTQPALLTAPYREIARAAGIAVGSAVRALKDLELRGYVSPEGAGPRRLLAARQLMEEWVVHYPIKLRPKLHPRRYASVGPNPLYTNWKDVDPGAFGAVWGGEVAASILTDYLRPETVTLYTRGAVAPLLTAFRLKPSPLGNVEILEAFWDTPEEAHPAKVQHDTAQAGTAHPLLVYADLLAAGEARCIETARLIYERFLA